MDVALLRHFLNRMNTLNIQYSTKNIQSLQVSYNIPNNFFAQKDRQRILLCSAGKI